MENKILELIHAARTCFAHINVYHDQEEGCIDKYTDLGIQLLHKADELITNFQAEENTVKVCRVDDNAWHFIKDGKLPERGESVLFHTISGQVSEGFLETVDIESIMQDDDGKITMKEYEDGGRWYRYRFRDMLPMKCVKAWRYADIPAEE